MHIDNIGKTLPSDMTQISQRTQHIDVHHHIIQDYVEEVTVNIKTFQL